MKCSNINPVGFSNFILVTSYLLIVLLITPNQLQAQEKKVLFLGNSYTAVNDLPGLFTSLALSGGHTIYADKNTPGGYTLAYPANGHLYNQTSLDKIASENWDYVVLQEQSQFPVIEHFRNNFTYPGSIELDSIIELNYPCTQTMFYMTWGRKYGGQQCIDSYCSVDFTDYAHMQDSLASAYLTMSNYLETPVCPVGIAWKKSIVENGDPIELFATDASHPSLAGSYLAACTYYASIFLESPIGLTYTAGLSESDALYLQTVASETVLNNLELWNIDTTTVKSDFTYEIVGGEVIFNNLSINSQQYNWDFGNGDSDTTTNPVYTYLESGQYEVILEAISSCEIDSSSSVIDIVISDIFDINKNVKLKVYPNPATVKLIMEYRFTDENAIHRISIMDSSSKELIQFPITDTSGVKEIDISELKAGNYYITIISEGKIISVLSFVKI